ncbi:uncharacterized protein [Amphiura filiformis]|uniref:uncharacterized protein n=1 Tax=Amphiura filiformis TaxID=82378 RepID=UPI003B216F4D
MILGPGWQPCTCAKQVLFYYVPGTLSVVKNIRFQTIPCITHISNQIFFFQRQPKWEEEEVLILAACEGQDGELFGSAGGAGVEVKKRKAWKVISEVLGSAGYSRTWEVVRKKWADVAFRAKQYRRNRIGANTLPEDQDIDNVHELHVDKPGPSTSRKRVRVVKYDSTEVESQSSQYLEVEKKKKKKKKQKNISKKKDEGVTLLEMNREIQEVEKRKLEVQEGILGALLSIDATLKKLLPQETAIDLFNQMQTEQ